MLCRTLEDKPVVRWVKAVTWPPTRHYAHVEFNSNAIMDAHIEQTAEFCLNDAYFCMSLGRRLLSMHQVKKFLYNLPN